MDQLVELDLGRLQGASRAPMGMWVVRVGLTIGKLFDMLMELDLGGLPGAWRAPMGMWMVRVGL